jgi:hypothetical protein
MESDAQRNALLQIVQREEGMEWADERTGWKNDQTSGKFIFLDICRDCNRFFAHSLLLIRALL